MSNDDDGAVRQFAKYILGVIREQDLPSWRQDVSAQIGNLSTALTAPTYITQTPSTLLTNEQALSVLATGYVKVTTTTGVLSSQATPIPPADGGTGVNNATRTLTISTNSGTLAFASVGSTLTVPETGTAALLGVANTFTALNTFNAHINASRVGIGVTGTPGRLLEIVTTGTAIFLGRTDSDSINPVFEIQDNSPGQARTGAFNFLNSAASARGQLAYLFASDAMRINTAGTTALYIDSSQLVGLGTATPGTRLHVFHTNATTNAVDNLQIISHDTSGTAAAGFGSALAFRLESSTTSDQDAARMKVEWVTATHASRAARGTLSAFYTSTERTCIQWEANATVALVGFLGTAPVAKQTVTGSRGGNAALASLLTALATFGLITDSSS